MTVLKKPGIECKRQVLIHKDNLSTNIKISSVPDSYDAKLGRVSSNLLTLHEPIIDAASTILTPNLYVSVGLGD